MASPIVSATLDKTTYALGATITLTVVYSDPDAKSYTGTATATDAEGNKVTGVFSFNITDAVTVAVADSGSRVWTKVSDTGSTAVYTTTA